MSTWIAVAVAAVIVGALRTVFVAGNGHVRLPAWFDRIGRHVAPAMAAALLAPRILGSVDTWSAGITVGPATIAYLVAVPVALRTRSVGWTLGCGMTAVWIAGAVA